jgi:small subunit ribosomal protein S6
MEILILRAIRETSPVRIKVKGRLWHHIQGVINREEFKMPYYETVLIARQDLSAQQVEELKNKSCKILEDLGGKIHKTEDWGLRSLAFRIKKNRKGHYVLIESDAPAEAVHEMERTFRLNEDILRYMTIKLDELSKGPSAQMGGGKDSDSEEEAA